MLCQQQMHRAHAAELTTAPQKSVALSQMLAFGTYMQLDHSVMCEGGFGSLCHSATCQGGLWMQLDSGGQMSRAFSINGSIQSTPKSL